MKTIEKIKQGKFELYLHEKQKKSYISGKDLLAYLKENNLFEDCASLEDLEAIKKEGIDFFRKYFEEKFIFAWKSVRLSDGYLDVPYLYGLDGEVVLGWRWTGGGWGGNYPALRFASSPKTSETNPSALNLDLAIETVKKAGYIIFKPI